MHMVLGVVHLSTSPWKEAIFESLWMEIAKHLTKLNHMGVQNLRYKNLCFNINN